MSEYALISHRVAVEVEHLFALSQIGVIRRLTDNERFNLIGKRGIARQDAAIVKLIETKGWDRFNKTNHDVKATELFLAYYFQQWGMADLIPAIHQFRTSEDKNSFAYALMLRGALERVIVPELISLITDVGTFASTHAELPMLARTHGQPATPTTLGKEFFVFAARLRRQVDALRQFKMLVKFGGASGNHNAEIVVHPEIDWIEFTNLFVNRFNGPKQFIPFERNPFTTQIEPHDTFAELFAILMRINTILIDFAQDIWRYVSDDWLVQKADGVGSSAMPHKINPINFENAEGRLGLANANFEFFCRKLPISRLQRDLSDSTVIREFGRVLGDCLIGYKAFRRGFAKISPNRDAILAALDNHPEVIAEAYQNILRSIGQAAAYDTLKDFTQGKKVTLPGLHEFVDSLQINNDIKKRMKQITPRNYVGYAASF